MKKLLTAAMMAAVVAMVAGPAGAAIFSEVSFTVTPDTGSLPPWTFVAGLSTVGTDAFDGMLDAVAPPWPPGPEVRMHCLDVAGAAGPLMRDYRDGMVAEVVTWTPAGGDGIREEIWGNEADLLSIDGSSLGTSGEETGTLTWDLTNAGDYAYYLYDFDADAEILLEAGGSYEFSVIRRGGIGPVLALSADCTPIPEPGTMLLLGSGLVGLIGLARKR